MKGDVFMTSNFRENYLGKRGTKRIREGVYRTRISKLLAEGRDKAFICSHIKICGECYEMLSKSEEDLEYHYRFEHVIERKVLNSGRVKIYSRVVSRKVKRTKPFISEKE